MTGPVIGEGVPISGIGSPSSAVFLSELGCEMLSKGQYDGISASLGASSCVMLSGPGGAGLTLAGMTAAVSVAADRLLDVLCVAPCRNTLKQWQREYAGALAVVSEEHGFLDPLFCEELPLFERDVRKYSGRIVLTCLESFQDRLAQAPDLKWLTAYGFVLLDSIDALLARSRSATAIANALSAVRDRNPDLRVCLTCLRFEDNSRFAADLAGMESVDTFECESREGAKTFVLWSAPLDREKFGGTIEPGGFFEDLVSLCSILARSGRAILLYDPAGIFCRAERDHLVQQVTDGPHATSIEFCEDVTRFAYPRPEGTVASAVNTEEEPVRVCLGLQMPIGVLRDRLRAVAEPETLVVIVEARTPAAGLHRHAMSRQQAGLSSGLPSECRFLDNGLRIGMHNALRCVDSGDAFRLRKRYLDSNQIKHLTKTDMDWTRHAWSDLLAGRLACSMMSLRLGVLDPLDLSIETAAGVTATDEDESGRIPTDYYPGALVIVGGRRYQVIRTGPDLRRPWQGAEMQPAGDLDRETSRLFTVTFKLQSEVHSLFADLQNTLFPGVTYGCRTAAIQETVDGFETLGRFSGDLHRIGGSITPIQYPSWISRVLLVKIDDQMRKGPESLASLCAILPDAIALRLVTPRNELACVMLDEDGRMCRDSGQRPVAVALYARDPMDHAAMDILGTAGFLIDAFRMALALLLACPCSDGCACCINMTRLPVTWRERIDKDGLTRLLGRLLGYSEAEMVADDRHQMRALERVVDRVRDVVVPHQFRNQLGLDFPVPVTLRHLVGRLAAQHPDALGIFTGDAVYLRPDLRESTYIGMIAHEYMHQWQRDYLDPDLEKANGENIEDPDNVLFPAYHPGSWNCRGTLYVEGGAEWLRFRVADAYNLKTTMEQTADGFRGNEYGEGFQHVIWLERKYGVHELIAMMRKDRPDTSIYKDFSSNPNPKTALYEASLLYAALSDSALDLVEQGGFACCESRGDWPFYTRVSHYRAQSREAGMAKLPDLETPLKGSTPDKSEVRRKTHEELVPEMLAVSISVCLDAAPAVAGILAGMGLKCAGCVCSRGDRHCSLRTVAYMHSNATTSARKLGESLAKEIGSILVGQFDSNTAHKQDDQQQ